MTRTPILALALAALAAPALAQEEQQPTESEETRPTNQTSQFTTEGQTEENAQDDAQQQPENAMGTDGQGVTGGLVAGDGTELGNVSVSATASGHALVLINAEGFREGIYGVHIHQFGRCEGPGFETAGEHISGGDEHGVYTDTGPHPGDLPNAHVGPDEQIAMEAFAIGLTLDMVIDDDGSALIVTAEPDDYTTQPAGNSGERVACAVLEPPPGTMTDETVDAGEEQPEDEPRAEDEVEQAAETGEQPAAQEEAAEIEEGGDGN
jgi:Cu-Zn family superoxide dismutase